MSGTEMALVEPEVEVVAKASRRRFTVAYKRKIVREADGCKPGFPIWSQFLLPPVAPSEPHALSLPFRRRGIDDRGPSRDSALPAPLAPGSAPP
jgi:hypothetical protein